MLMTKVASASNHDAYAVCTKSPKKFRPISALVSPADGGVDKELFRLIETGHDWWKIDG